VFAHIASGSLIRFSPGNPESVTLLFLPDRICSAGNPAKPLNPYFGRKRLSLHKDESRATIAWKDGPSDSALVSAMRSGDEQALANLYDRYSGIVYAVALRILSNPAGAEDILQDVFMGLWRNPSLFDSSRGNLAPWLAVIARNRAIDSLRKRKPETDIADVVIRVEPTMAGEAERAQALQKVRGTLETMPGPQRNALEMAYFEGLTHVEIAKKTGEPLGTIKTRIRAGLLALRRALAA